MSMLSGIQESISKSAFICCDKKILVLLIIIVQQFSPLSVLSQVESKALQRPEDFKPYIYKLSTEELKKYTKDHLKRAAQDLEAFDEVIYTGPYKASNASIAQHKTPEWYSDAKLGIALNYSIYSVAGYGNKGYGGNYYTDTYLDDIYLKPTKGDYFLKHWGADVEKDDFIPYFTANGLDAEAYIKLFKASGARYFVQFNMHRSTGMLLWDSNYTFRDAVDMSPHRDLTGELVQACRKYDLPYGMYLNLEDSFYPLLNEKDEIQIREWTMFQEKPKAVNGTYEITHPYDPLTEARRIQGKVPVYDYVHDYLLPVAKEFIDTYEPDYLWFDGGWKRPAWYYDSYKIVAYYYNKFEGKKDVMVNARMGNDLYGKLGDVIISEGGQVDNGDVTDAWEEIRPFGKNFAYDWREHAGNTISSRELIHMLIRIVAKGGNLLLIVAPNGDGVIPDYQVHRLNDLGKWLDTHGEAIYNSRPTSWFCEESIFGRNVYYTRSKDEKNTYAICLKLDGEEIILSKAKAKPETEIRLLGYDKPLAWKNLPWGLTIQLPEELQNNTTRPDEFAWVFKFEAISDPSEQPSIQAN